MKKHSKFHFFLVGHPLGHSFSPFIHEKLFRLSNINASYDLLDTPQKSFDESINQVLSNTRGFNITIPYKQDIIKYLRYIHPSADAYGAVNTVAIKNGNLSGYNTDGKGFLHALNQAGINLSGNVLIAGSGGAGRVFAYHAAQSSCNITLMSNSRAKSLALYIKKQFPNIEINIISTQESLNKHYNLFINATPVGMYPNINKSPIPESWLNNIDAVFDAVYNPIQTLLIRQALGKSLKVAYGVPMLVKQAVAAHKIWLGTEFSNQELKEVENSTTSQILKSHRPLSDNIILTGFMGSGKSTVGKIIANRLSKEFIDIDQYIQQKTNLTVADIFKTKGQHAFRLLEQKACKEICQKQNVVISTGGGTIFYNDNLSVLKSTGTLFLLHAPYNTLIKRIHHSTQRPLVNDDVNKLYNQRKNLYINGADYILDSSLEPQQIADIVISLVDV